MKNILIIIGIFLSMSMKAQVSLQWQFYANTIENTAFILSDSRNNIYTIGVYGDIRKFNHFGDTLLFIPDTANNQYTIKAIMDHDENILVLGDYNFGSTETVLLQKYDTSGNRLWSTIVDVDSSGKERASSMTVDQNNDIYITGKHSNVPNVKFYTAKVSSTGSLLWHTDYQGSFFFGEDQGLDVAVYNSNNIYAVGNEWESSSFGITRLIKYNQSGDTVWTRSFNYNVYYGLPQVTDDNGLMVEVDPWGNIYIVSHARDLDMNVVISYDSAGNRKWVRRVHTGTTKYIDLIVDSTGIYFGGSAFNVTSAFFNTPIAAKLDTASNTVWSASYTTRVVAVKAMARHADGVVMTGSHYICGGCDWDGVTIGINGQGQVAWDHVMTTGVLFMSDEPFDICVDRADGVYVTGNGNATSNWMNTYKLFECDLIQPEIVDNGTMLTANYIPGAEYIWHDCDSDSIVAQGPEMTEFVIPYPGNFTVEISVGDCSDTTECDTLTSSVNAITSSDLINIYPNPSNGKLFIQAPEKSNIEYSIYGMDGTLMLTGNVNSKDEPYIDISELSKGFYFIRVECNGSSRAFRIVKM